MVNVTLPDGAVKSFPQPVKVADVAASIGAGLAKAAIAGRVNGALVDTSFLIEHDSQLSIVTERDADAVPKRWHQFERSPLVDCHRKSLSR
jgi:threonyl-tRNA synthetase